MSQRKLEPVSTPLTTQRNSGLSVNVIKRIAVSGLMPVLILSSVCFIFHLPWIGLSVLAGLLISLIVCVALQMFVDFTITQLAPTQEEKNGSGGATQNSFPVIILLGLKFLGLGGVCYLLLSIHSLNLLAVLSGFVIAQTAIIYSTIRDNGASISGKY